MKPHAMILLRAVGLAVGSAALIVQALAQQGEIKVAPQNRDVLCPQPGSLTIQATAIPSVNQADFFPLGPTQSVGVLNAPGSDQVNHIFRYTFNWKVPDGLCCEITGATLTAKLRWNGGVGHPRTASNDKIAIMSGGKPVTGMEGYIWGPSPTPTSVSDSPYTGNQIPNPPTKTIIMNINTEALKVANGRQLSFQVEDDTTVESAVLEMKGCCVTHFK